MAYTEFTTTMGNEQGTMELNGRFAEDIGHVHDGSDMNGGIISYNDLKDKPTNMATADKLRTPRTINGVAFDGSENIAIAVSSGQVGVVDNIVNGMEVTVGTGLQAIVGVGRVIIDETVVSFTNPLSVTLEPRMASLVYAKVDGSVGKVDAKFPLVGAQTLRYILDGSATIASTGIVTNIATKTGTVAPADGRIGYSGKGDGTTGYYTCASATGVPAYSSASTRILVIDSFVSNSAIQIFHNDGISKFGCTATNNLTVNGVDTGFTLENGGTYVIALPSDASTVNTAVYVNGSNVATGAYITNATAVAPTFYSGASGASKSPSQLAYFEYYAIKLTPAQISAISNALLLPNRYYTDQVNNVYTDIRSILPANSIPLGYTKTSSTAVIEVDSVSYKYGIRKGATGGNRRVRLGYKLVGLNTDYIYSHPFDTENMILTRYYKKNLTDTKHIQMENTYSSAYGSTIKEVSPLRVALHTNDTSLVLSNQSYTGATEITGHVDIIAEVIE